ncbi:uncharacterized protein LOC132756014 [Ruditapes philippinarum]|uniref:uncharacterized protein LOC132756014 n=1 Tax=Ruditapes philippinarum TaxID=129788 RepID=UPI00295A6344|nr:uncharacterized protein LOC132756014 [Ruditapes philippinarum]
MASSGNDSVRNLVPEVVMSVDLKNVSDDEEEKMSHVLQQLFEEVIDQDNDFVSSIPPNSYVTLRAAVKKTFQLFHQKGWRITRVTHGCIHLQIQCSNFKSLTALFREHTNGEMDNHLTDLNEALTEYVSGGQSCLETTIYKDEFLNVLDESISSVDRYLSELNINFEKKNDNVQPLKEGRRHTLSFTARKIRSERSESFEGDYNNEVSSCLQFLKTELESEFSGSNLLIQPHSDTHVNRKMDDTYTDDEVEKLDGQGNTMPTMSDDVKISKSCTEEKEKEISFKFKDEEKKYDKAAIKRSLEEIDPTKEAHAKRKYQSREKKEIAKQINWKRFSFTVTNQLREPFFNNSVSMEIEDENCPLIKYMEKAVAEHNGLMEKFTTYVSDFGYKIEAINDAKATPLADNSSWKITTQFGPTPNDISSFKPEDGMNVLVELQINGPDDN